LDVVDVSRRERTRQRLLDAALEVFAEQGVPAAPIELIAERAGFSRGAFYSNFDSKFELFLALAQRENDLRLERLRGLVASLPSGFRFPVDASEIAGMVERFLEVDAGGATWVLVLGEFRMLALRDPDAARRFLEFERSIDEELGAMLGSIVEGLGMVFTIAPAEFARLASVVYEAGMQESIMSGESSRLSKHSLAKLVQAFTQPKPSGAGGISRSSGG